MQNLASVHIICLFLNHILNIETKQPEWLTIIESYIKSQTVLKISVADLCAITNYSKTHLNRLFRSFYDMTTLEYIVGKKINYAGRMLECTDYTIDYISEMAGFSSKGHFIKLFKQKYNTTPGRYRKQVNVYANIK
jgi:AraC-like DNA-binding protein